MRGPRLGSPAGVLDPPAMSAKREKRNGGLQVQLMQNRERMQPLNVESAQTLYFIVEHSIRSLPLAVLHWGSSI